MAVCTTTAQPHAFGEDDLRICGQFMVPAVVEEQHNGHLLRILTNGDVSILLCLRLLYVVRQKHDPINHRTGFVVTEPHLVLAANAEAREGLALLDQFGLHDLRRRRRLSVHLTGEDVQYLTAAGRPLRRRRQLASVRECERILQRVRGHLCLIIVRRTGHDHARQRHCTSHYHSLHHLPPSVSSQNVNQATLHPGLMRACVPLPQ